MQKQGGITPPTEGERTNPPTVPQPREGSTGGLTTAAQLMSTGIMNVPTTANGLVIWIPNEGHHAKGGSTMAPQNYAFLPQTVNIPLNTQVAWVSDDEGHVYGVKVTGMSTTKSVGPNQFTAPMVFNKAGTFPTVSTAEAVQKGTIKVSTTPATGNMTVGACFVPTAMLEKAKQLMAGFKIESTHNFTQKASGQSVSAHTCIVYSSPQPVASVAAKMVTVTKMTPYT